VAYGQGHGGVQGHLHFTHRGTPTLLGQELHKSEPVHTDTQHIDLSMLYYEEQGNQDVDSESVVDRAHEAKFITLWESNHVGTEEGRDLETLY